MKLLLLAIAACCSAPLQAQEVIMPDKSKRLERAMQFTIAGKDTIPQPAVTLFLKRLHDGRVRILPQDGMPCIVPDTSGIAVIPNGFIKLWSKDPQPGRIPNAWQAPRPLPRFDGVK